MLRVNDSVPLDHVLRAQATFIPHRAFIKFDGKKFTFREMDRLATGR